MNAPTEVPIQIYAEATPNPASTKYNVNRKLLEGLGRDFPNVQSADGNPLAATLFTIPGVTGVYIGPGFVTVTSATREWKNFDQMVIQSLEAHLKSGQKNVSDTPEAVKAMPKTEAEAAIKKILDEEIRPAVAQDGGDIIFAGFEQGTVYLQLRGSCNGCPSSLATLKFGIEQRLKMKVPDVEQVVAV